MNIIEEINAEQAARLIEGKAIPEFRPGDTVIVNVKVKEASARASRPMRVLLLRATAADSTRVSPSARFPTAKALNACFRFTRR